MDGYIKKSDAVDVIVKYPYNISGKTATAIKMIEELPEADVVSRAELSILTVQNMALEHAKCNLQHELNKYKSVENMAELITAAIDNAKKETDTLKSLITQKEDEAYNKGYADAKADLLEKLQSDIARDEILAEYGDELFEGRIAGFKVLISYLKEESDT